MAGTKYLTTEGLLTYNALSVNDIDQATRDAFEASDKHKINADGTIEFKDKDGSWQTVSSGVDGATVDLSAVDSSVIQKAADITYLSQNTGVKTTEMNAVYESLGIDPSDPLASVKKDAILRQAGYKPGEQVGFYGNNQAQDLGAQILVERNAQQPTEQDMIDAGLDPSTVSVVNSNTANAAYLAQELAKRGADTSSTSAYISTDAMTRYNESKRLLQDVVSSGSPDNYWNQKMQSTGSSLDDLQLDMLEWDLIKKKAEEKRTTGTGGTGRLTGTIGGGSAVDTTGGGQITGGGTGTYTGPNFVSTPNIGAITDVYGAGQTGLTETAIPTYEAGLGKQQTQFEKRAEQAAGLIKPQTLAEQQAAGEAPAFENRMYRNRFGMVQYIQFIKGPDGIMRPTTPIPQGYYEVQGFGAQQQVTGVAQGGVIQGYNEAGLVNPAMNFKPGGTVVQASDGTYKIKYPDGTYSQSYDTALNAKAANDMGTSNLGLPDYGTYLQQQGYDRNLPGYNQDQMYAAYQSYIQDPATLEQMKADQAAAEAAAQQQTQQPIEATVGSDMPMGETQVTPEDLAQYQANLNAQAFAAPGGAVAASPVAYLDPNAYGTVIESTAGQALGTAPMVQEDQVAQISSATTADVPVGQGAATYTANQGYADVQAATEGMTAATMAGPTKEIEAAQQTGTSLSGLTSATGDSINVSGAPTRTEQTGEMITGTGVDQAKVGEAFGTGEVQAASVQGELANLMAQFEGGDTPAWAAGSMRAASQMLAARGLGASSMAGQAIIQAAMESALPIAQIDASNKQQVALFKAEQRAKFLGMEFDQAFQAKVMNAAKVSEIANMNFTAEQQIALENSKAANTMALQNLTNKQALVMAEAAALAQMDTQNLNNRQQAAVQNAQNFLQIDMANLSNSQQTALFKQQSLVNSILSDQAAANAAAQFNATSENQTNQFFSNLAASVNQFNAAQMNAMKQFNADEVNGLLEFNAALQNQREMFNAQNYLVVAQANAQWRQNINTLNTAAANQSNMDYAKNVNNLTQAALDEIWMRERDLLSMAFQSSENTLARNNAIVLQKLAANASTEAAQLQADIEAESGASNLLASVFMKAVGLI